MAGSNYIFELILFGPRPSCTKMSTSDLFDACRSGDIARVRQAVADGVDVRKVVNKNSWLKESPLHYACRWDQPPYLYMHYCMTLSFLLLHNPRIPMSCIKFTSHKLCHIEPHLQVGLIRRVIEWLRMTSPIIINQCKFSCKFTSAWQADSCTKVPYSSHRYSFSKIAIHMDAFPLGLYYCYASLWKNLKIALQSERFSLNLPCGSVCHCSRSIYYNLPRVSLLHTRVLRAIILWDLL